ncbi:DUF1924 domain-containing protein [Methylotenera sp.]|uniref:DUF1924 domain-containing protein n=1 Tax=Methylotenera sp. TaxID=2051956 RepID=UPI0025D8A58D|nr:DUF1924 domain-containing protein [Methylotenera sp.]
MKHTHIILAALLGLASLTANAAQSNVTNAEALTKKYIGIAQTVNPEFVSSVTEGKMFFNRKIKMPNGKEMACASCHTTNPANVGKHALTGKSIEPLSPAVNKKRFSDLDKVEEKFTEHCNEIIGTDCTAAEKANYIIYLLTERTPSAKK